MIDKFRSKEELLNVKERGKDVHMEEAIELCCMSKAEELRLIGYHHVTSEDIWEYIAAQYKKQDKELRLHQIVNDILAIKAPQFMNFMTISAYKGSLLS